MEQWRYEKATQTIRSVPGNHWIATMDSWDGAENHEANARLIAAAPDLLEALKICQTRLFMFDGSENREYNIASNAIAKAEGK